MKYFLNSTVSAAFLLLTFFQPTSHVNAEPKELNMGTVYGFEPNFGEWDNSVLWRGRLKDGFVYVTDEGLHFNLYRHRDSSGIQIKEGVRFMMSFSGKGKKLGARIKEEKSRKMHPRFKDNERLAKKKSETILHIEGVYHNIDLELYTENGQMRFDMVALPGSNINDIEVNFEGQDGNSVNDTVVSLSLGDFSVFMNGLNTFKGKKEKKNRINSRFKLDNGKVKFEASGYNSQDTVIIDPIIWLERQTPAFDSFRTYMKTVNTGSSFITASRVDNDTLNPNYGSYILSGSTDAQILIMRHNFDIVYDHIVFGSDYLESLSDLKYDSDSDLIYICGETKDEIVPDSIGWAGTFPITHGSYSMDTFDLDFESRGYISSFDATSLELDKSFLVPGIRTLWDTLLIDGSSSNYRCIVSSLDVSGDTVRYAGYVQGFLPSNSSYFPPMDTRSQTSFINSKFIGTPSKGDLFFVSSADLSWSGGTYEFIQCSQSLYNPSNEIHSYPVTRPADSTFTNIFLGLPADSIVAGMVSYEMNSPYRVIYAPSTQNKTEDDFEYNVGTGILNYYNEDTLCMLNIVQIKNIDDLSLDSLGSALSWDPCAFDTIDGWYNGVNNRQISYISKYIPDGGNVTGQLVNSIPLPPYIPNPVGEQVIHYVFKTDTGFLIFISGLDIKKFHPSLTNSLHAGTYDRVIALQMDEDLNTIAVTPLDFYFAEGIVKYKGSEYLVYGTNPNRDYIYELIDLQPPSIGTAR